MFSCPSVVLICAFGRVMVPTFEVLIGLSIWRSPSPVQSTERFTALNVLGLQHLLGKLEPAILILQQQKKDFITSSQIFSKKATALSSKHFPRSPWWRTHRAAVAGRFPGAGWRQRIISFNQWQSNLVYLYLVISKEEETFPVSKISGEKVGWHTERKELGLSLGSEHKGR